jgi:hypothetical protein
MYNLSIGYRKSSAGNYKSRPGRRRLRQSGESLTHVIFIFQLEMENFFPKIRNDQSKKKHLQQSAAGAFISPRQAG